MKEELRCSIITPPPLLPPPPPPPPFELSKNVDWQGAAGFDWSYLITRDCRTSLTALVAFTTSSKSDALWCAWWRDITISYQDRPDGDQINFATSQQRVLHIFLAEISNNVIAKTRFRAHIYETDLMLSGFPLQRENQFSRNAMFVLRHRRNAVVIKKLP